MKRRIEPAHPYELWISDGTGSGIQVTSGNSIESLATIANQQFADHDWYIVGLTVLARKPTLEDARAKKARADE